MLIAEIRRKLIDLTAVSPDAEDALDQVRALLQESKEDLLTADVFGVLKYLPRRPYLEAVLEAVAAGNPQACAFHRHLPHLLDELAAMQFSFWPTYPTPSAVAAGSTEPDVVLEGLGTLLVVEAKLGSGFGDQQVERELAVALDQAEGRETFLLLVPELDASRYVPRGRTALLDAVGRTIETTGKRFVAEPEDQRPGQVLFVILTDGYENSSEQYTGKQIFKMIQHQQDTYNWQFIYLGANQDAIATAASYGIAAGHAMTYDATPAATSRTWDSLSRSTARFRSRKAQPDVSADFFTDEEREASRDGG